MAQIQRVFVLLIALAFVSFSAMAANEMDKTKAGMTDADITGKVIAKLAEDNMTKTLKLDVETNDGVVTLKGDVQNKEWKQKAEDVARKVKGVKDVKNKITVQKM
jgi:hyperosmotically inducible protein